MTGLDGLSLRNVEGGAVIAVKAVPGASRDKISGVLGDALKVATSAPPEKGKANAAIAKTIAKALGIPAGRVKILSGQTSPRKEFFVEAMNAAEIKKKLEHH